MKSNIMKAEILPILFKYISFRKIVNQIICFKFNVLVNINSSDFTYQFGHYALMNRFMF